VMNSACRDELPSVSSHQSKSSSSKPKVAIVSARGAGMN
jgi:hypothetical protein